MGGDTQETVTRLLGEVAEGRTDAASELLPLVYDELRALAGAYFRNERDNHTLQPTALVHEAYMRLVGQQSIEFRSRRQFFVVAAKAMRNILVDHARTKRRQKRGGGRAPVALDPDRVSVDPANELDMLALDEALERLAALDERKARLVELRFFGGLTSEQAADVLDIARSTAAEEWRMARAWLYRELDGR
ncbi:MAG: sigma-70 family RNA polymerase sigma factor [Planctomycetota bacterium]|jgi:RNA polymerase sigma factor (TIGR02999 family)